ncbi:MFS transporter [Niveomyces insectorum RCEF 264]|uniref:MFS transporter n=1 Tax=Niveomyces insectorum RCEF 264 TaxID=1081102 RepID=A0A167Y686_9HYPO|nr:MFS transporter [Niveomyces insectorum RCEF 264]
MDENLDERAIRELEEILGTDIYPGTEIMRDVGTHHFVKARASHAAGAGAVLVPQPAADPADPLNWTFAWKSAAVFAATVLSFSLNLGPLALAPMFGSYAAEWDRSLADVVQFTGVAILVLGFSNFLWVPIMVCWGRRPVALGSTLVCACSSIWRARATSYNSFMGASVLNGIGAGPCETLMPQVIADIIFLHDRGKYQTLYFSMYFISLMIGPIISGAMDYHTGWRSFWWFNTGLLLFAFLCQVFLFPETRYDRAPVVALTAAASQKSPAAGHTDANQTIHKAGRNGPEGNNNTEKVAANEDDEGRRTATVPAQAENRNEPLAGAQTQNDDCEGKKQTQRDRRTDVAVETAAAPTAADNDDPYLGCSRPGRQHFRLFQPYRPGASLLRELWLPLYLHLFPIVEFAAFVVSFSASAFLVVNLSQTQAFAAPPYNDSSQTIGLFNLAVFLGACLGLATCGPLSDSVAAYLTRRNGGVREPEMRLVAMVPYAAAMVVGSVVVARGYDGHWPWPAVVVVGYSLLGLQVAALPSLASTYAIDSYRPVTGSLFVTITVNKNVWGYGVSRFLTPWAAARGFTAPVLTNMALTLVFCLFAVPCWIWGKKLRGLTKDSFVHKL